MHLPAYPKRKFSADNDDQSAAERSPCAKRHKKTPASFFDTLSRQWLTRRTLREFERRCRPVRPAPKPRKVKPSTASSLALKQFARRGGPDLDILRGYPEFIKTAKMPRKRQNSNTQTEPATKKSSSKTGRSSAYDAAFQGKMIDHGMFPFGRGPGGSTKKPLRPNNWRDIYDMLAERRASLSPTQFSEEKFEDFAERNRTAETELDIVADVLPILAGENDHAGRRGVAFNNLAELAPDIKVNVVPDFYDGSQPTLLKKKVRDDLGLFIVPSTSLTRPIVPNFFVEAKGPDGRNGVVANQALHGGVIGARGLQELRAFAQGEEILDGNAYTITSTYTGGITSTLALYTVHPTHPSDASRPRDYYVTQLRSFAMTDVPETFRQGATAFRNARDWAMAQREAAIAAANARQDELDARQSDCGEQEVIL